MIGNIKRYAMRDKKLKDSKFYVKDNTPFKVKVVDFLKGLLFWKGRKKGIIHTMNIKWDHVRAVFFPKNFHEKYRYLGSVPWNEEGDIFKAMEPLIIFMDYKAKPWWCPRWFLRFLHLFGSDNSIVRVRNRTLHNLSRRLTKGFIVLDYKTKWHEYDLRISISGNSQMWWLATSIESKFYYDGRKKELLSLLSEMNPNKEYKFWSLHELEAEYKKLIE